LNKKACQNIGADKIGARCYKSALRRLWSAKQKKVTVMRWLTALAIIMFISLAASPAAALGCGFPPADYPTVPNGETATREQINVVIEQVRDFGARTNEHLNCLEIERDSMFLNMNRDQQERWTDDFNAIVDKLSEVETSLNEQIRIFNARMAAVPETTPESN